MKIAFLSFYSGLVERGVETVVGELAERLGKNHEVTVFQAGPGEGKNYNIKQIDVDWKQSAQGFFGIRRRLYLDRESLSILEFTRKVLPKLKSEKYDIVVPWNNGWQTILCKFGGVGKIVVVGEAGLGWDDRVNLLLFPDSFVGFTKEQINWAKRVNPFVKTDIIPNGVNLDRFKPEGPKKKIDLPRPIIMSAAALVPMKRLDLAIKAVSLMEKGSLVLVGLGQQKNYLENLGKKLLPGRFQIIEAKYSEIDQYYRAADVFTFPTSSWESFGIVMLEAMATNIPVVAANDPIRREIIGEGGLAVNVTDSPASALMLEKALETKWGNKPRRQAENFSWDKISEKYEELFLSLTK